MKFFNILFLAVGPTEYKFLEYRHTIDVRPYLGLNPSFTVTHLKLKQRGFMPNAKTDEVFFTGRNAFFELPFKLSRHIRRAAPEVIMIHGFTFPIQLLMLRALKPKKTKLIIQHHAEKPFTHPLKHWFQKIAYSKADAFLFASNSLAKPYLATGIIKNTDQVHEVMEGSTLFKPIDKKEARATLAIPDDLVFLWVGRLDSNKDPLTVLKAMDRLKRAGKHFTCYMIYGTNELEEQIRFDIAEYDLKKHIILLGKMEHHLLETWYSAADYFVAASHEEGSGIALCEAMACGCIPVVTNIPSFATMTCQGRYGVLFEPGNESDLFEKLLSLEVLDSLSMGASVHSHFLQHLSPDAIGKRFLAIAESLLRK
jgi:glycosyltransferase involved in cell wall biosynthesis